MSSPSELLSVFLRYRLDAIGLAAFALFGYWGWQRATRLRHYENLDRAETIQQLLKARNAAHEASLAKDDFLSVMNHEIRTPLNAVTGFASLLAETELDDTQREFVATINGEGRRLAGLVDDILDLANIEAHRTLADCLPFSPLEIANGVLETLSARALEKKIDLRFEANVSSSLFVAGDPRRFRQVLVNLIDNAIRFTPQGSVTLTIAWAPAEANGARGGLAVRVGDTGIGIPPDKLPGLFQLFTQIDASGARRYAGTGLGLASCQRFVALMGGEIVVRSTHNEGTEFSFSLPVDVVEPFGEVPPANQEPHFNPVSPPHILIVDDMEANRLLLAFFLTGHGFKTEMAVNGREAIQLAAGKSFDAILMDLQMPEIDGFAAVQCIRAAELAGRRTPIIAITASSSKGTREKCLAMGMDEYLAKPLDLPKLKVMLNRFVAPPIRPTEDCELPDNAHACHSERSEESIRARIK